MPAEQSRTRYQNCCLTMTKLETPHYRELKAQRKDKTSAWILGCESNQHDWRRVMGAKFKFVDSKIFIIYCFLEKERFSCRFFSLNKSNCADLPFIVVHMNLNLYYLYIGFTSPGLLLRISAFLFTPHDRLKS